GLFDVADALEPVLSSLVAHQGRQFPTARADALGRLPQERDALGPRTRTQRGIRGICRGDRVARLLAAGVLKRAQQNPRVDGAAVVELAGGANLAAGDHQRLTSPERTLHPLDGDVELAMQVFHLIAAHRRVRDLAVSHWGML